MSNNDRISMVAVPSGDGDSDAPVQKLLYFFSYGILSRENGEWVPLDPSDTSFEDEPIISISPEKEEEFLTVFDGGNVKVSDVNQYSDEESVEEPVTASTSTEFAEEDVSTSSCPPATQDIQLNLTNRQKAIDTAGYGPLNPNRPNEEFWSKKATRWQTDIEEAKTSRCGNCVMFIRTPKMLDCIEQGLGNEQGNEAWDVIDSGQLGYCEAFDFKCASARSCDAWVVGGPVTEEKQ